ncbi:MAG: peptidyl-prolyl cis-trans isomerase SurA [Betaproteobacteria bacterium]|jgi:peptidyl-prolyl cis-trans isomerase SurA|nr:peptidyl-prolyl cis-trans isomerase SurA [Betaproteobacteria bacterium]
MRALLVFIALLMASAGAAAQRASLVDRIVAIVNKEVITASELADAIGSAERELRRRGTAPPERSVLERQMLERLILDKAQTQMARDTGIRVDELQLDRAVQRIAEGNKMSLAEFRTALERDGLAFDAFRQDVREQIVLTRLREREVDDKIQVSDSEIDLFLEAMKAAPGERTEYNLAHILVRVPEQANPEQVDAARRRAEQALGQARGGGDFAQIAATYSNAPEALQGGGLGWRAHDRLPELFAEALDRLKPGDTTPVLRSPAGFHILKMLDRRVAGVSDAPIPQTRLRHILIRTSETVSESEARRRLNDLRRRILAKEADFAEMARVHSDDATSARGGELDWVYPGDTVPDFERAFQELQVGEISEPVRTPFGMHLIQVLERRSADMSAERRRLQARQALRERKGDEAYNEWLRQLRDLTYVELRLEER